MPDYLKIESYNRGLVFDLLYRAFKPLMNQELEGKLKQYDTEIFDNPGTVSASLFLTQLDAELIGMASWDPRQFPKAIVGYNCIVPKFQGKGFGKQQLSELLKRLKEMGFTEVLATTGDQQFYVPSQKMYESCGFTEVQRNEKSSDPRYRSIDYQLFLLDN